MNKAKRPNNIHTVETVSLYNCRATYFILVMHNYKWIIINLNTSRSSLAPPTYLSILHLFWTGTLRKQSEGRSLTSSPLIKECRFITFK